jgi:hypothetical protein
MLGTFDRNIVAEDRLENAKLGSAEPCARFGGLAYRAVMLHQQQVVTVLGHLGHVTLRGTHPRKRFCASGERASCFCNGRLVIALLVARPERDDIVEHIVAGDLPDRLDQLRREFPVPIGKEAVRTPRQVPTTGRPPGRTGVLVGHRNKVFFRKPVEMLPDRCRRKPQFSRELSRSRRATQFQAIEDPPTSNRQDNVNQILRALLAFAH